MNNPKYQIPRPADFIKCSGRNQAAGARRDQKQLRNISILKPDSRAKIPTGLGYGGGNEKRDGPRAAARQPAKRPDPGHPACLMATLHGPEMTNIQPD